MFHYQVIPLDEIILPKDTSHLRAFTPRELWRIIRTTEQCGGLLHPVGVSPENTDGLRTLVFGFGRVLAFHYARASVSGTKMPLDFCGFIDYERQTREKERESNYVCNELPLGTGYDFAFIQTIELANFDGSSLHLDPLMLSMIENHVRADMHPLDQSALLHQLKQRYESLHPEARVGATGGGRNGQGVRTKSQIAGTANSVEPFVSYMSKLLNISQRSIYELLFLQYLNSYDFKLFRAGKLTKTSAIEKARKVRWEDKSGRVRIQKCRPKAWEPAKWNSDIYKSLVGKHAVQLMANRNNPNAISPIVQKQIVQCIKMTRTLKEELRSIFYGQSLEECQETTKRQLYSQLGFLIIRAERLLGSPKHIAALGRTVSGMRNESKKKNED